MRNGEAVARSSETDRRPVSIRTRMVTTGPSPPLAGCAAAGVPFDPALLPKALRPWIMDIAERLQCPPDFSAVAAMVSLGAVVGRRLAIRPKRHDDWLVVPNLWGAVVGRPA